MILKVNEAEVARNSAPSSLFSECLRLLMSRVLPFLGIGNLPHCKRFSCHNLSSMMSLRQNTNLLPGQLFGEKPIIFRHVEEIEPQSRLPKHRFFSNMYRGQHIFIGEKKNGHSLRFSGNDRSDFSQDILMQSHRDRLHSVSIRLSSLEWAECSFNRSFFRTTFC